MANAKIKIEILDDMDQTVAASVIETSPLVLDSLEDFRLTQKTVIPAVYKSLPNEEGDAQEVLVSPETVIYKYTDIADMFKAPVKDIVSRVVEQCPPVAILQEQQKIQAAHETMEALKQDFIKG